MEKNIGKKENHCVVLDSCPVVLGNYRPPEPLTVIKIESEFNLFVN